MDSLTRRNFLASMGTIAAGGLAGMSLTEALAQPIDKLAEHIPQTVLGATGWKTPIIGFGTLFYAYMTKERPEELLNDKESDLLLNTGIDLGINVFETGIGYGNAEYRISRVLPNHKRDKLFISSKTTKRDKDGILKEIEKSLATLKTDYLDMYQIWDCVDIREYQQTIGKDGAFEGLKQAQKEGKIRFTGLTGHSVRVHMEALRFGEFDSHLIAYSPVCREFERCLTLAAKIKKAVMIMKPYGWGITWGKHGGVLSSSSEDPGQVPDKLTDEEALRFVLSNPGVTIACPGHSSLEYLKRNVAIAATFKPLTPQERKKIIATADRIRGGVCGLCEGKPCEKVCPNDVPISWLMSNLQYMHRFFIHRQVGELYTALPHDYLDCDGCGECEKGCPKKFAIRKDMKEAHDIIRIGY